MHTPKIEPYVTAKGGVVILNGPFPLDEAERVRALCAAAPELLRGCQAALAYLADPPSAHQENRAEAIRIIQAALSNAQGGTQP